MNNLKIASQQFFFRNHNQTYASGILLLSFDVNLDDQYSYYLGNSANNLANVGTGLQPGVGTEVDTEGLAIAVGITIVAIILGTIVKKLFERRNKKELVNLTPLHVVHRAKIAGENSEVIKYRLARGLPISAFFYTVVVADINDPSGENLKKLYAGIPGIRFREILWFPGVYRTPSTRPYVKFFHPVTFVVAVASLSNGKPTYVSNGGARIELIQHLQTVNHLWYRAYYLSCNLNHPNIRVVTGIDENIVLPQDNPDFMHICGDLEYITCNLPYFPDEITDNDESFFF